MRIALRRGTRVPRRRSRRRAAASCIVNESLARHVFPGESALGKMLMRGRNAEIKSEIVGVIRDVKTNGLNAPAPDEIYYPMRQLGRPGMNVVARTTGDPAALQAVIRAAVAAVDKDQPISFFATLETNVATSLGTQRIVASLTAIFAGAGVRDVGGRPVFGAGVRGVAADARRSGSGWRSARSRRRWSRLIMRSGLELVGDRPGRSGSPPRPAPRADPDAAVRRAAARPARLRRGRGRLRARRGARLPDAVAARVAHRSAGGAARGLSATCPNDKPRRYGGTEPRTRRTIGRLRRPTVGSRRSP